MSEPTPAPEEEADATFIFDTTGLVDEPILSQDAGLLLDLFLLAERRCELRFDDDSLEVHLFLEQAR